MKKKLIMILCAVVSLSLAACGGTVETDSDSRTEREVEDDDSRDKEDKKKGKDIVKRGVTYHNLDNSFIYFNVTYAENDIKFTEDNMDFILSEFISNPTFIQTEHSRINDYYNHYEKYKETEDLLIYKIYSTEEMTEQYLESTSLNLEDLEDYLAKYINESERERFIEDYNIEVRRAYRKEVDKVYEIYKETKDYPVELFIGVKGTNKYYRIGDASPIFMCNIDAFIEGLFYLETDKVPDLPKEQLESIGYNKRDTCASLSFYIPEKVSLNWNESEDDIAVYESKTIKEIDTSITLARPAESAVTEASASASEATASSTQTEIPVSDSASTTTVQESKEEEPVILDKFEIATDFKTLEGVDVESEVAIIRDYYYATQNNLGNYMLEEHPSLTMYHEAGFPVKIFVKSGYNDWDYTREYFYHDQELYFAFVYNNNEQHRLYFKDGIMIRYIDENGNTFDYGNLNEFYSWEYMTLYDSYNIYPTMPNCGA